jgi:hypothetical protein
MESQAKGTRSGSSNERQRGAIIAVLNLNLFSVLFHIKRMITLLDEAIDMEVINASCRNRALRLGEDLVKLQCSALSTGKTFHIHEYFDTRIP